jgi:ubiquinone/menaquinone biosynthesis C-methylase UbiE
MVDARAAGNPREEVARGNPWYVRDQFEVQMGNAARRHVVLARWKAWGAFLADWSAENPDVLSPAVLDAGCGDGVNLAGLDAIFERLGLRPRIYGLDYNALRLSRARDRSRKGFIGGDLTMLPFMDGAFDIILANHVLEHIVSDEQALSELRRILVPGGLLVLGVPNEGCALARLRNYVLQPAVRKHTDHVNFYTWSVLEKRLQSNGFEAKAVSRNGFFVPHMRLHQMVRSLAAGRHLTEKIGSIFQSQCADLIISARPSQDGTRRSGRKKG